MPERLFVYGTLRPGESNEHYLSAIAGRWMDASIKGIHFPEGYGATVGYPVIVPSQHGPAISGLVLEAEFSLAQWQMLDDFETEAYERVIQPVTTLEGAQIDAFVYVLNQADLKQLAAQHPELQLA